jgi:ribosomal protein L25 (general stress protein Ctc)
VPLEKVVAEWAGGRLQAVYGGEEEKENSNCEQDYYATSVQKEAVEHDLLLNEYRGKRRLVIAMGVERQNLVYSCM